MMQAGQVKCNKKGHRLSYNIQYDAYFCKACNKWLEKKCQDLKCDLCMGRPRRPIITK